MSTYIIHQSNIAVSSVWQDGAAPSLETRYREFNLADMPQGAVITNALLSCEPWGDGQQQTMNGSAAPRQELPADSVSPGGVLRIPFVFQGKNTAGQPSGACAGGWNHITLTLTYQVRAPSSAPPPQPDTPIAAGITAWPAPWPTGPEAMRIGYMPET